MVNMLVDYIIPWLTTRTVIYPRLWLCLPAPSSAMLSWSGTRTKVLNQKLPTQSWDRTYLIALTTSTANTTVVSQHPAELQWVASCWPRLVLLICIHSWWIPGTHYRRATNRVWIHTVLPHSSVRSNRQRIRPLPRSSAWKQCVLTMLFLPTIWPPKWRSRNLRLEALTQTSRETTHGRKMNYMSGCQGSAEISKRNVTKLTRVMPCSQPAGDDVHNSTRQVWPGK